MSLRISKFILSKNLKTALYVHATLAFGLFLINTPSLIGGTASLSHVIRISIIFFIFGFSLHTGNQAYNEYLELKFSWIKQLRKRLFWSLTLFVVVNLSITTFLHFWLNIYFGGKMLWPWELWSSPMFLKNGTGTLLISLFMSLIFQCISFFTEWKTTFVEKEKLKTQHMESQLTAMKNQLNPHFLFNSLNVLSELVHEDADLSEMFIQKLSHIYRYILAVQDKPLIELSEELKICEDYIFLQKIRFEERLIVDIHIDPEELNTKLPPLCLQLLLENAMKHNQMTKKTPLKIEVIINNDHLIVRNNMTKKNEKAISMGLGLQNIDKRYTMLNDKGINTFSDQESFEVHLPLIKEKQFSSLVS
ncbi:sensor histidine kinase [Aureibacter tunicatorum]|uniref:Signal transduction histidine kinase internal region domain-containing protein n=1 Tax=Aureibacter tunicatorum TaxID=866807 RepID=A0AAE3XL38_9BACT|nr:histidine kinase [Aureibacter tunicatorum]MDR6237915.1 hypothetical protein [Aureibacter tunicatorum]BDD02948.1 hypothetical protein AUTU_04310 [Aureibacter tunicatorum]